MTTEKSQVEAVLEQGAERGGRRGCGLAKQEALSISQEARLFANESFHRLLRAF